MHSKADGALGDLQGANCMDSLGNKVRGSVGLYGCHGQGGNQQWTLTDHDELMHDEHCVETRSGQVSSRGVTLR